MQIKTKIYFYTYSPTFIKKGAFTYYVITKEEEGRGGLKTLPMYDYGRGGLALWCHKQISIFIK